MGERGRPAGTMATYVELKRALIGTLNGRVLEIGAGRGANFGYLRGAVEWVGLEPDARRHRELGRRAERYDGRGVLRASAERIPLAAGSVDAVVGTVVLCSVADQAAVLAEILRVLRPGGRYVFFEHVAAPERTVAWRMQRLVAPLTRRFDGGCDPSRRTWRAIEAAGFADLDLRWFDGGRLNAYGRHIAGTATAGTATPGDRSA